MSLLYDYFSVGQALFFDLGTLLQMLNFPVYICFVSSPRNDRLAWIYAEIKKGQTNAAIVANMMQRYRGLSERDAKRDLKDVVSHMTRVELDASLPETRQKFLEIGFSLLEDCRQNFQLNAAVSQFKTLAAMAGVLVEKGSQLSAAGISPETMASGPDATIRERIANLLRNRNIQTRATQAEIDLAELAAGTGKDK